MRNLLNFDKLASFNWLIFDNTFCIVKLYLVAELASSKRPQKIIVTLGCNVFYTRF